MRILVTGAFGFIGTAVVHRFAQNGHDVTALTSRPIGQVPSDIPVAEVVHGSLLNEESLSRALRGADGVVHLGALTRVRESFEREREYHAVNVSGTASLVRAAQAENSASTRPLRFVFASTGSVYDTAAPQPFTESSAAKPTNPYAQSKMQAEEVLRTAASESSRSSVTILRLFNVAGAAHGRGDGDLSRIIPKALAVAAGHEQQLQVNGDGSALRDFVHVSDVASALTRALLFGRLGEARTYNVGATSASVADIIKVCGEVSGRAIPAEHLPPKPEPQVLLADCSAIRSDLDWTPKHSDLSRIVSDAWAAVKSAGRRSSSVDGSPAQSA
ncbi:NAD-dependent epimerase/dehydratase family protein [Actinospica robiniae]|uniref:NAD-dependent epimerase/dehydratase family protein n=1 Tax=Actinospica robiniae TaxID=304901 RepID=UPI0004197330|nr:NAD-dependent epimerase/dehydratase family protein [Actinospica robiniae]